jgi:hypothetical protein
MALASNKQIRAKYALISSQGFPTHHLRHLVRDALDYWEHRNTDILAVYGIWDFDIAGINQV